MNPELRILTCILLEKMKQNEEYVKRLGLSDNSQILSKQIRIELNAEKAREKRQNL